MGSKIGKHPERDIGARADLEHGAEIGKPLHQIEILDGAHPMTDARGAHRIERVGDAEGAADLA